MPKFTWNPEFHWKALPTTAILAALFLFAFTSGGAQVQAPSQPQTAQPAPTTKASVEPKSVSQADLDRKKELEADTAKLLDLANELKTEMDKTTKDTLSLSVVRKAQEIERLAHKVREEMRSSIGNN